MVLSPPSALQWTANSPSKVPFGMPRLDNELVPAPKRPRSTKVRHYERQKNEKAQLTQQLAELSELLKQEQAKKKLRKGQQSLSPSPSLGSAWQSLARRHLEDRLASEAQRRWLQVAITGKVELIKDLKDVVRQHLKIAALIVAHSNGEKPEFFLEPTEDLLYALDLQDCNELYTQTDSVFSSCGLDPTSESPEFQRSMPTDSNGVSIQYTSRQLLLFNFDQTCESIWMLAHLLNRQEEREEYAGNKDRENTLAMKFRITDRLPSGQVASMTQRVVCRRFKEPNRMVFVTKSFLAGEGPCRGMQTDECGWTILRPSASGSGTVMEVCMKQVPLHLNSANAVPRTVVTYYNELLQTLHQENLQEVTSSAESLLLDDVLTGINV